MNETITIFPNPFGTSATITINDATQFNNFELKIYNDMGAEMMHTTITRPLTTIETGYLPSGIYFYNITSQNKLIQSGKLVSQQ
jgi:hypothetical protein